MLLLWVLAAILSLFLLLTFTREVIKNKVGIKLCSICTAVSLTWIALLILKLSGYKVDTLLLGILMGESITGAMYSFETTMKQRNKNNLLWLKIVIITGGTLLVYLLLTQGFSTPFLITAVASIVFAGIVYILSNRENHEDLIQERHGKFSEEIKKLEEQLEHCCD